MSSVSMGERVVMVMVVMVVVVMVGWGKLCSYFYCHNSKRTFLR
jgi:hypothetical protein